MTPRSQGRASLLTSLVLTFALTGLAPAPAGSVDAVEPVRVLLVGDSVTQGSAGDWTWRYRLWKHLQSTNDGPVDLVGPRTDLWDDLADQLGNHDYVDPAFDQDHAARWGMTFAFADNRIEDLVATYQPDVVVEMLGVNDLSIGRPAVDVDQDVEDFVVAARTVDPEIDVVVAEAVQTWFAGVAELNALLPGTVADLDDPDGGRVVLADTDAGFLEAEHTYDTSHPDPQGEVLIAAAVADALATVGVGAPATRPLPTVPRGPRIPPVLQGALNGVTAVLSWVPSPGANTTTVEQRDVTAGAPWSVVADLLSGTTWRSGRLQGGHAYEYRVRPRKGWWLAEPDAASVVVTVRVPRVPGRPTVSVASRPGGRAVVTWRAVRRADYYTVELRRVGRARWLTVADRRVRTRLVRRHLVPGAHYDVRVTPVNATGDGPSDRVRFTVPEGP